MAKYHISPTTGNPNQCRAIHQCPFGGANEHYDSKEDARAAYEAKMVELNQDLVAVQGDITARREAKKAALAKQVFPQGVEQAVAQAVGDQKPLEKPFTISGEKLNAAVVKVNDEFMDEMGVRYRVTKINTEAKSTNGKPVVSLNHLRADGSLGGYTVNAWEGGVHNPETFTSVPPPNNGFKEGVEHFDSAIIASVQKAAFSHNPEEFLQNRRSNMVQVIVPDVAKLTDRKRLEIGREAWKLAGKPLEDWDEAPEKHRISWTKVRMGRSHNVKIEVKGEELSWTTDTSVSSNYLVEDSLLLRG